MGDLLYETASKFEKLTYTSYKILLGRKGKSFELLLRFPKDSFFHLVGLQYLADITFSSKIKERTYNEILEQKITIDDIKKSVFFEEFFIEERLSYLKHLEEMLDNCKLIFLINPREYREYTNIRADYLCEYVLQDNPEDILYFFLTKDLWSKTDNVCVGCSFFKKHDRNYRKGTAQATLLLAEKIVNMDTSEEVLIEIYRNPAYKENFIA